MEPNLAFLTPVYRGYRVKGFYQPESTTNQARIELWQGETRIQTGLCPAYKIWNYYAHASDIIDDLCNEMDEIAESLSWEQPA